MSGISIGSGAVEEIIGGRLRAFWSNVFSEPVPSSLLTAAALDNAIDVEEHLLLNGGSDPSNPFPMPATFFDTVAETTKNGSDETLENDNCSQNLSNS